MQLLSIGYTHNLWTFDPGSSSFWATGVGLSEQSSQKYRWMVSSLLDLKRPTFFSLIWPIIVADPVNRYAWVRTRLKEQFGDASFTSFVKMIIKKGKRVCFWHVWCWSFSLVIVSFKLIGSLHLPVFLRYLIVVFIATHGCHGRNFGISAHHVRDFDPLLLSIIPSMFQFSSKVIFIIQVCRAPGKSSCGLDKHWKPFVSRSLSSQSSFSPI